MVEAVVGITYQINKEGGSILLSEHSIDVALDLASQVYVMSKGKIISGDTSRVSGRRRGEKQIYWSQSGPAGWADLLAKGKGGMYADDFVTWVYRSSPVLFFLVLCYIRVHCSAAFDSEARASRASAKFHSSFICDTPLSMSKPLTSAFCFDGPLSRYVHCSL